MLADHKPVKPGLIGFSFRLEMRTVWWWSVDDLSQKRHACHVNQND